MKKLDLMMITLHFTEVLQQIQKFKEAEVLKTQAVDVEELKGHILKSDHNLRFVSENIKIGFYDWGITGCYYTCYHAALALILSRGFFSKNHLATLCIIIKEFYNKGLDEQDIETLSNLLDYQDVLFYVESKNKREDATYSTKTKFDKAEVEQLKIKAALFVSKVKSILREGEFLG